MTLTLQQQTVTKETAQRMAALGFPQESLYCWKPDGGWHLSQKPGKLSVAAYNVAELGEILPFSVKLNDGKLASVECYKDGEGEWEAWLESDGAVVSPLFVEKMEAEAKGLLACYLKENKLI